MDDVREILLKMLGRETISTAANKAADGMDNLGDSAEDAKRDLKRLEEQAEDTERQIAALQRQLLKDPGDIGLRKQLRALDRESKFLSNLHKRITDAGDEGAAGFAARFSARIGPLLAQAPVSPPILAGIAAGAPAIGAAVSAAVLLGLSGGTVAVGVKAALADPRVAQQAEGFGKFLGSEMQRAVGDTFSPATVAAMKTLRAEVVDMRPDIDRLAVAGASFVAPLTRGAAALAREALPGMTDAVEKSGSVIRKTEQALGLLGKAGGSAMSTIADGASGAALAIGDMAVATAGATQFLATNISMLSKAYTYLRGASAIDKTAFLSEVAAGEAASANFKAELEKLRGSLDDTGAAATGAAGDVDRLNTAMKTFQGLALAGNDAERRFQESIDAAREAMDGQVKALDLSTPKGRAYSAALDEIATSAQTAAQNIYDQTGSQQQANAKIEDGRAALINQARAYGLTKAEAIAYANKVLSIPTKWETDVTADTRQAEKELREARAALAALRDKTIRVRTIFVTQGRLTSQGERVIGDGTSTKYATGGIVTGGIAGRDSVPILAMPGEGVLNLRGMKALGGKRTLDALNAGRATAPGPTVGMPARAYGYTAAGTAGAHVTVGFAAGSNLEREILRMIRFTVETNGGSGRALGIRT